MTTIWPSVCVCVCVCVCACVRACVRASVRMYVFATVIVSIEAQYNCISQIIVPSMHTTHAGRKTFLRAVPRLWNNLTLAMCASDRLSSFKKKLKKYMFKREYVYFKRTFIIAEMC